VTNARSTTAMPRSASVILRFFSGVTVRPSPISNPTRWPEYSPIRVVRSTPLPSPSLSDSGCRGCAA
jgi:hypothetical protein